jgi:hypothetical protein
MNGMVNDEVATPGDYVSALAASFLAWQGIGCS